MKFLLFVQLLLVPVAVLCQNAKIDSLKRVIETTKADTVKGRTLCRLCHAYSQVGLFEDAIDIGERGLDVCRKAVDRKGEGDCLNNVGNIYWNQSDYPHALKYHMLSLKIREKAGDRAGMAASFINIGIIYNNQGDYPRALDNYQQGVKIAEAVGMKEFVANGIQNIGILYWMQGDFDRALKHYQRSLKLREEIGDPSGVATSLGNIGNFYNGQGDYPRALDYYQRSLKISEEINDQEGTAFNLINIGMVYKSQGVYRRALDYCQRSLIILEKTGNQTGASGCLINIGSCYLSYGRPDSAQFYAHTALKLAQKVGNLEYKQFAAQILYQADSALGSWKAGFEAARLFHIYSDSMKNDEQSQELGRLESKAEYEKQAEAERQRVAEEKRLAQARANWMLGSAGGGLLLLLVIAFTLYQGRRKEKKANAALRALNEEIAQQKAEIEAMNAELTITLDEVNQQRDQLQEQHAKIEDSIRYASRIQRAILPSDELLAASMPPHFIHYQPKDIVSGDFYWMTRIDGKTYFATVDCTGHGVPGAFMSVLGSNLLHQIVDENQIKEPDRILAELDRRIAESLHQQFGGDSKDGMDLALVVLHDTGAGGTRTIEYAGAARPLWLWSAGEMTEFRSAKYSCGGSQHEDKQYPASRIEAQAGDRLYLFSDGAVDQFGGPKGRKLGSVQLQAFLTETAALPIGAQGAAFTEFFRDWMKARKQIDDVLLAGVAV